MPFTHAKTVLETNRVALHDEITRLESNLQYQMVNSGTSKVTEHLSSTIQDRRVKMQSIDRCISLIP